MKRYINAKIGFIISIILISIISNTAFADSGLYKTKILHDLGIINGDGNGALRENDYLSRAETARLLTSIMNNDINSDSLKNSYERVRQFKDVSTYHWAYSDILYLRYLGYLGDITYSDINEYHPDSPITYGDFFKILIRILGYGYEAETIGDGITGYQMVNEKYNLINIDNNNLDNEVSRKDAFEIIYDILETPLCFSYTIEKVQHGASSNIGLEIADGVGDKFASLSTQRDNYKANVYVKDKNVDGTFYIQVMHSRNFFGQYYSGKEKFCISIIDNKDLLFNYIGRTVDIYVTRDEKGTECMAVIP